MCTNCSVNLNIEESEKFAERMVGHINSAAITLMCSLGHRTGLFDAMTNLPPATSDEIAEAAGLNERYVREWLGAMVTGEVKELEHDPLNYYYIVRK